ncbi:hypothetical protein TcWFU_003707 [Taenia crassiceps]|uniref:Uncharacterized protein n=1 Tax=Taenia crassiceps TaxID=6207 RepID=A0ABR4QM40_9CEST
MLALGVNEKELGLSQANAGKKLARVGEINDLQRFFALIQGKGTAMTKAKPGSSFEDFGNAEFGGGLCVTCINQLHAYFSPCIQKYNWGIKRAAIMSDEARAEGVGPKELWKSPNGTIPDNLLQYAHLKEGSFMMGTIQCYELHLFVSGQRREEVGIAILNIYDCGHNGSSGATVEGHQTPALRSRRSVHRVARRCSASTNRLVGKATTQWLQSACPV